MKKVYIKPGCIGCGLCQEIAPEIFHVHNKSEVRADANIELQDIKIEEAARQCPMGVIVCEKKEK